MATIWESPSFVEIKMDAEIGSYQGDFEDAPDIRAGNHHVVQRETAQGEYEE